MLLAPPGVQFLWVFAVHHGGSIASVLRTPPLTLLEHFPPCNLRAALLACAFLAMQLLMLIAVPHTALTAILTSMSNCLAYRINGVLCYLFAHAVLRCAHYAGWWRYTVVHDEFGPMLAVLNLFALIPTVMLYISGLVASTNSDAGCSGHGVIWDLWQGTEMQSLTILRSVNVEAVIVYSLSLLLN